MLVYILSLCYFDFEGFRNHEAYIYNSILLIASIKSNNAILENSNTGVNSGTTNVAKNIIPTEYNMRRDFTSYLEFINKHIMLGISDSSNRIVPLSASLIMVTDEKFTHKL